VSDTRLGIHQDAGAQEDTSVNQLMVLTYGLSLIRWMTGSSPPAKYGGAFDD
jgi:hypothetical protein